MHSIIQEHGISGACYGDKSMFHVFLGDCDSDPTQYSKLPPVKPATIFKGGAGGALTQVRRNMLFNGVDCLLRIGICSMAHSDEDIDKTLETFSQGLDTIIEEGVAPLRE
jgi:glutamate-1-semialdehyde aminotransferase